MLPDDVFVISLVSRTAESCGVEGGSFEEVIPIQAYRSGDYTVSVNGVTRSFTLP